MSAAGKPAFPKWVPKAVRKRIVDELAKPNLAPEIRKLCVRLAEREVMQDVYESLPRPWNGYEHYLIDHVIGVFKRAISIQQRPPRRKRDFEEYLKHNRLVPVSAELIALKARMMINEMRELHDDALFLWERMWPGDPSITFDKLIAMLEQTATFYDYVETERRKAIADLDDPPPPTKRGAKRAPETWFSRAMSKFFVRNAGKPMDTTVEDLTDVVFGVLTKAGTAKKRRQTAGEHFRKKSK